MPELPEVQTIVTELSGIIPGKDILNIKSFRAGTINMHCEKLFVPAKIKTVSRRGKFIVIETEKNLILVHLRMTGKLIASESVPDSLGHIRAAFELTENKFLLFDDVRTFGTIDIYDTGISVRKLDNLGVEPLSEAFDYEYLLSRTKNLSSPIKNILLKQEIIAGIGNIYACEILFRSGVNPQEKIKNLGNAFIEKIVKNTKTVLKEAIECNGTTISDYRRVDDKQGTFQNFLNVYGKEYCPKEHKIKKIKQSGRSTYYCPICQIQENIK